MSLKKHTGNVPVTDPSPCDYPSLNLYTCEFYPTFGGIATYCHEMANAAVRINREALIYAPYSATQAPETETLYKLRPQKWSANHNPPAIWRARKLIRAQLRNSRGIHLFAEPGPILAYGSLNKRESRGDHSILALHGSEIIRWQKSPISRALALRALRRAKKVVCVSNPVAELAKRYYPQFESKISAVLNALPNEVYKRASSYEKAPTTTNDFNLLSVGRFHPRKGFDQVIAAIALLSDDEKSRITYTIVGGLKSPEYLEQLKNEARNSGIELECKTDATGEELENAYKKASAFALTSVAHKSSIEGFGLVYLEAGAFGLPCLAFDTGGVRDAVRNGETGYLSPSNDIQDLAKNLSRWLNKPDLLKKMGSANREFALSRTWDQVLEEVIAE